jgi:tRNA (guanine37-N1)-methyltransferase
MAMRCDVLTIFPGVIEAYAAVGVLGRGGVSGILDVRVHDLRQWAINRYGQVDDEPYGGGPGMVLMASVVVPAVREVSSRDRRAAHVVLPDARGRRFTDAVARELAAHERLLLVCGRYEGFDERVHELLGADEISLGDFVISGGELAALTVLDAVVRHVPGVVGDPGSVAGDSFTSGLLDFPVYTRPPEYEGLAVPDVLASGNHAAVDAWRLREAARATVRRRPDLIAASWPTLSRAAREAVLAAARDAGVDPGDLQIPPERV